MWSLACALAGHEDRMVRTADRLALDCARCGRRTRGWAIGTVEGGTTQGEEVRMNNWATVLTAMPAAGMFGWIVVRFVDWRRRFRPSPQQQSVENALP